MSIKAHHIYYTGIVMIFFLILNPVYSYGQTSWAFTAGGSSNEAAHSIQQTSDGGYIVAGFTQSFGAGGSDFWVLKLDASKNINWQKTYGGLYDDVANSIQQTNDGGYIVAGYTNSFGAGTYDFWVLKLSASGNATWQKAYGGANWDFAYSVQQTSDGGYMVAGSVESIGAGGYDVLILKLDASGNIIGQKTYGGTDDDVAFSAQQTSDGGYILAGLTMSFGAGSGDLWILKINSAGDITWQKTYGGPNTDVAESVQQTIDGGYIVAGYTNSFGAGNYDYWILKLDASGNIIWQKTYGGSYADVAFAIRQTIDEDYIVTGYTQSSDSENIGILKLDASGNIIWQKKYGLTGYNDPRSIQQTTDGGYIVAGLTGSYGSGYADMWLLKIFPDGGMSATCDFINSTNIPAANSTITPATTSVSPSTPSITTTNTSITGANATVTDTYICDTCNQPNGLSNNTAVDVDECTNTGVRIDWAENPANWGDGGIGTRAYNLYRSGYPAAIGIPYGITSYLDTAASMGQQYFYQVAYENGCLASNVTAGTAATDYPNNPAMSNTIANDIAPMLDTGVDIHWLAPIDWGDNGVNTSSRKFRVFRNSTDISGLLPASTLSFTDTGGVNNTYYVYHIDAINGCLFTTSYTGMPAADIVTQVLDWAHVYGLTYADSASSIQQTSDGGYIIAGTGHQSNDATLIDYWIIKINSAGWITWQKSYGGSGDDIANSIQRTSDGGYIVAGYTYSFGAGVDDIWILKLNASGDAIWQKTYGGTNADDAYSIQQTSDGGYIVAGSTASFGAGSFDIWILKLNSTGNVIWQKTYGGTAGEGAFSVRQTSDGGYIIAGDTVSFGKGASDIWILQLDSTGNIIWNNTYGGSGEDSVRSIQQTSDGGYIVAGSSTSFGAGNYDIWVLKLNSTGAIAWQKTYGGFSLDRAYSVRQTTDGDYIIAGYESSFGGSDNDIWFLKLNPSGNVIWQKTFGGPGNEAGYSTQQTADSGYILAGQTGSFGAGGSDFFIIKLNPYGTMSSSCPFISITSVSGIDSAGEIGSASVVPASSSLSTSDTTVSAIPFIAPNSMICSSCSTPAGLINNNATDINACSYTGVQVTWNTDTVNWGDGDSGARFYSVLRDGSIIASDLPYGTTTYIDTTGTNGTTYTYAVRYNNGCGLLTATTGMPAADVADTTPCPNVGNTLKLSKSGTSAVLIWADSSSCPDFNNYKVYASTTYSAPYPSGWSVLGQTGANTITDLLTSSYIAYKAVNVDFCNNHSPY